MSTLEDTLENWIAKLEKDLADLASREGREVMEQETDYTIWDAVKRLDVRLDALETFADDIAALLRRRTARHNAQAHRVEKLEKWVDGTDLITSERFCALAERIEELELYNRCLWVNQYKLIERVDSLERPPSRPAWERDLEQHERLRGGRKA